MAQNKFDLDNLRLRQLELEKKMQKKREDIQQNFSTLFAPPPPSHNIIENWMNKAQQTAAIVDGVLFGYKMFKGFRKIFPRSHKK